MVALGILTLKCLLGCWENSKDSKSCGNLCQGYNHIFIWMCLHQKEHINYDLALCKRNLEWHVGPELWLTFVCDAVKGQLECCLHPVYHCRVRSIQNLHLSISSQAWLLSWCTGAGCLLTWHHWKIIVHHFKNKTSRYSQGSIHWINNLFFRIIWNNWELLFDIIFAKGPSTY